MSSVSLLISSKIFLATREFPGSIEKRCGKATWSSLKATHFSQETALVLTKKVPKFDRKRPLLLRNWSCFSATPIFGLFRSFFAYRKTTLDHSVRPRPEIRPPKFAPQPTRLHTPPPCLFPTGTHQRRTLAATAVHHCQKQSPTNPAIVVDQLPYQPAPCIIPSHQPTAPSQTGDNHEFF